MYRSDVRVVVTASTAGTLIEWYEFFSYASLSSFIPASSSPKAIP